jgi:REP element-mobilizing transposase RayT
MKTNNIKKVLDLGAGHGRDSRSYFVSTHGHVSSETIEKYIEE